MVNKKLYSREFRLPLAVPLLIIKLAKESSQVDPWVGNFKDWNNPQTGETGTISRRWTLSSQRELAYDFLTLHKDKFEMAMKLSKEGIDKSIISKRKFGSDSTIPSGHTLST